MPRSSPSVVELAAERLHAVDVLVDHLEHHFRRRLRLVHDADDLAHEVVGELLGPGAFAVRGVIYNDSRGGYIDNVPATFRRKDSDVGIHYANYPCPTQPDSFCVPPGSPTVSAAYSAS